MAIQFARIELVGRSGGGNACCKGAYNARIAILDHKTNINYNFSNRGDNIYHEIFLPTGVVEKFKSSKILMNEVERSETRKNSSLLKDIVIALPDDQELSLQDRINITHIIIDKMQWVAEGLGVQLDIHQPHDGEKNWHAHLLVTKRRFAECGTKLGAKARDLDIQIRGGNNPFGIPEEEMIHEKVKDIINGYFKELGLANRVDAIGINPQEHIGPVRMRNVLNQAMDRNEERRIAEIEILHDGNAVVNKVTRHMSVFSKGDLVRAVKIIENPVEKEKLVQQALADKSIIELFKEDGSKTGYFTTEEIRQEEQKILRLADYVVTGSNNGFVKNQKVAKLSSSLIARSRDNLTAEQHQALTAIITTDKALHILRGRAGVGKSHVLRQVAEIAKAANINVIGLSPTHKAKEALKSDGFERTDTVKGMLFKLHNAKFELPTESLLVVDEAGMIGNDDYQELLRVAATRNCQIILAGDERQLASVQRGGMFEVFAEKYGSSTILDIRRQSTDWGKAVAMAFASSEVRTGIAVLEQENRINWQSDANESMQVLLTDWYKSSYQLKDTIILAVANKDVTALNHGARQYLKAAGVFTGQEIAVAGNHYLQGDRILITKSSKELGLINGDLATIIHASSEKFIIKTAADKELSFNPAEYHGFRHGYATTIFKAPGASIKDVYLFHNGFAGLRNSYVALSRNIHELNLYVNKASTAEKESLIKQLSYDPEIGSSLNYLTFEEVQLRKENIETLENRGLVDKMLFGAYNFAARNLTKLTDKYLPKSEYYNYQEPATRIESVEEVLDRVYAEKQQINNQNMNSIEEPSEEKLVVAGNQTSASSMPVTNARANKQLSDALNPQIAEIAVAFTNIAASVTERTNLKAVSTTMKQSAKERFYAKVDYQERQEQRSQENRYRAEVDQLRGELIFKVESIVTDLLGIPNSKLSNGSTLKYGNNGSLVVKIAGSKAGTWYDFSEGEGGDLFDLVMKEKNLDFKGAVDHLKERLGVGRRNVELTEYHRLANKYQDYIKNKAEDQAIEAAKLKKAEDLYTRSKVIERGSTASRYLVQTRKIDIDFEKIGEVSDIRTAYIYEKALGKKASILVAFARDNEGKITGGQQITLDSKTCNKADIEVPKKSFGRIAGSFVEVSNHDDNNRQGNITIIAEGVETALSLSYSGLKARILCSLGINNISNYPAKANEKIIIAADNDGKDSVTNKTVELTAKEFANKGALVEVVRPQERGDFNDILQKYDLFGALVISEQFEPIINKLNLYSSKDVDIIVSYEQLNSPKTPIKEFFAENKQIEQNLVKFNPNYDMNQLQFKLEDLKDRTRHELLKYEQYNQFKPYLNKHIEGFNKEKASCTNLREYLIVAEKEKEFCVSIHKTNQEQLTMVGIDGYNQAIATYLIHEKRPNLLEEINKYYSDSMSLKIGGAIDERRMYELYDKKLPLNRLADNMFRRNQEFVVGNIKNDLNNIDNFGFTLHGNTKYNNKTDLLNIYISDKLLGSYGSDFANKEISKIQSLESTQKIELNKSLEEKQAASEPIEKVKPYDFELG